MLDKSKEIWSYCSDILDQQKHRKVQLLPTWEWDKDGKWKLCDDGPKDPSVLPLQHAKEESQSFDLEITDSFRKWHAKHILFKALHQVWKVYSKKQPRRTFAWSLSLWRLAGSNCRKFPGMVRLFLLASSLWRLDGLRVGGWYTEIEPRKIKVHLCRCQVWTKTTIGNHHL